MSRWNPAVLSLLLVVAVAPPARGQSIQTAGNIETDAQLVSKVATGTAPLAVSSTTMVPSLNADQVDGIEGADLALDADLQSAETMLVALQAQVDALGLALVPRTGQTTCYDVAGEVTTCGTGIGLGQDGDLVMGVQWPNPRFTDNGNGTVTDNLTGLIWLEDASCFGTNNWEAALALANGLADCPADFCNPDCGLSDLSVAGQWRLPNLRELQSLMHYGFSNPAVPNTVGTGKCLNDAACSFSGVVSSSNYWSSTTDATHTATAWFVVANNGIVAFGSKTLDNYVWPVRGGQ